jgi:hypothetical protein
MSGKLLSWRETGDLGRPCFIEVQNTGTSAWGPGALRFIADGKTPQRFSIAYAWPVETGETISLFIYVGQERVSGYKHFRDFAFVEWTGTVHEVSGRLKAGMFKSKVDGSV